MRSFNELLQSPRALKMLLAGGSVMTLLLIGLLVAPAWVRSKLEREARARGFEAHVEGVSFGLTRVWARGVRLTSPGSDFELKLDAVGVGVSSNEVVAHGGTLRGSGDPDPILRKLRGRSERPVDGEGGSSGRALELEGLYLQWRRGGMTLEAFGVRASRNAEGASAGPRSAPSGGLRKARRRARTYSGSWKGSERWRCASSPSGWRARAESVA